MADEQVPKRSTGGFSAKQVLVGILVLVIVVLAIANSRSTTIDFVVASVKLPLFVVIIGSALIGWVVGWFMGRKRD